MAHFVMEQFNISKINGKTTLTAELSTLEHLNREVFHRAYPDSCDQGITVIGVRNTVSFVVDNTVRDNEGDLQFYHLIPTRESLRRVPECHNVEVVLFND